MVEYRRLALTDDDIDRIVRREIALLRSYLE